MLDVQAEMHLVVFLLLAVVSVVGDVAVVFVVVVVFIVAVAAVVPGDDRGGAGRGDGHEVPELSRAVVSLLRAWLERHVSFRLQDAVLIEAELSRRNEVVKS